jgi:hypothetical protein
VPHFIYALVTGQQLILLEAPELIYAEDHNILTRTQQMALVGRVSAIY